jgi:hypothetical protein
MEDQSKIIFKSQIMLAVDVIIHGLIFLADDNIRQERDDLIPTCPLLTAYCLLLTVFTDHRFTFFLFPFHAQDPPASPNPLDLKALCDYFVLSGNLHVSS